MEFDPKTSQYLIIKVRSASEQEFWALKDHMPVVKSHYNSRHRILCLAFAPDGPEHMEKILRGFAERFPDAEIVETSLASSPVPRGYVKRFSDRLILHCPENDESLAENHILLRSSLSFGSGFHPTTEICMSLLENAFSEKNIEDVFDLGTGSAILALAAFKLGANRIVAADIDLQACIEAQDNVRSNKAEGSVCVVNGTYSCVKPGCFDLLLANLTVSTLLTIGPHLPRVLRDGGLMVFSGFTPEQSAEIEKSVGSPKVLQRLTREGWTGLLAAKGD